VPIIVIALHCIALQFCPASLYVPTPICAMCYCCSLLSPDSCPKESKQASIDKAMDTSGSGKVKLHIANVPYEMKWQELKDLLRDRGKVCYDLL